MERAGGGWSGGGGSQGGEVGGARPAAATRFSFRLSLSPPKHHPLNAACLLPAPAAPVIGRSNVGKSSLINLLTGRNSLAMVSKTPGGLMAGGSGG